MKPAHLLEIDHQCNGGDNFRAKVTHINAAGPMVKVDLITHWGAPVHVELSHGKYSLLALKREDTVFVHPRERRVFVEGESGFNEFKAGRSDVGSSASAARLG